MEEDEQVIKDEFYKHRIEYEKRHGELSERVTRLESVIANLATKQDLEQLKASIVKELLDTVVTRTDVDWLKRAFWFGMGMLSSAIVALFGLLLAHMTSRP